MSNQSDVKEKAQTFTKYFVKHFETKFIVIKMVLDREVTKTGKFAEVFARKIGAVTGGVVGYGIKSFFHLPEIFVDKFLSDLLGEVSKFSAEKLKGGQYRKKYAKLADFVYSSLENKAKFRKDLVRASYDLFQSFEMQFMNVTTKDEGYRSALNYLAEDAVNRAIKRLREDDNVDIAKAVVLGESKFALQFAMPKSGFEVMYEPTGDKWRTAYMYKKVGLIKEDGTLCYYEKKKNGMADVYGYRRLFKSEEWDDLKEKYKESDRTKNTRFRGYPYTSLMTFETLLENTLENINENDEKLNSQRIIDMIKSASKGLQEEIESLKGAIDDSQSQETLNTLLGNIKQLNIDECFADFKQCFEESKLEILERIQDVAESVNEGFRRAEIEHSKQHEKTQDKIISHLKKDRGISFDVRPPVCPFFGREKELNELHAALQCNHIAVVSQALSNHLGGVGKSELVSKYIVEFTRDYDNVVWINAESQETLSESFRRLACKLDISTKNPGEEETVENLMPDILCLFPQGRSLFVLDKAENSEHMNSFLPSFHKLLSEGDEMQYLLITSCSEKWPGIKTIFKLGVFTDEESTNFIETTLEMNDSEQKHHVKKLAETLQHFPSTLQLAVGYIRVLRTVDSTYSINDYLEEYEEFTSSDDIDATVLKTLKVTFDHIKKRENGNKALEVMNIIAYLPPEGTPVKILFDLLQTKLQESEEQEEQEEQIKLAFSLLQQYSTVSLSYSKERKPSIYKVHRLVQEKTKTIFKEQEMKILKKVLKLLADVGKFSDSFVSFHSSWHDKLIQELKKVPYSTIVGLCDDVQFEEGYLFGELVLEFLSATLEANHRHILTTRENIAMALSKRGKHKEALKQLEDIYELRRKIPGSENVATLSTLNNLALAFDNQGKYVEALEIYRDVCKGLGSNNPNALIVQENIAAVLVKQGKYKEALQEFGKDFELKENRKGTFEPAHLSALNGKAGALAKMGKYDEALEIYENVYDKRNSILGPNHSDTLTTLNNIAVVLQQQRKYDEAFEKYTEISQKSLHPNHPFTLNIEHNIASLLEKQGEHKRALEKYEEVFKKKEQVLGPDHPDTLTTSNARLRLKTSLNS